MQRYELKRRTRKIVSAVFNYYVKNRGSPSQVSVFLFFCVKIKLHINIRKVSKNFSYRSKKFHTALNVFLLFVVVNHQSCWNPALGTVGIHIATSRVFYIDDLDVVGFQKRIDWVLQSFAVCDVLAVHSKSLNLYHSSDSFRLFFMLLSQFLEFLTHLFSYGFILLDIQWIALCGWWQLICFSQFVAFVIFPFPITIIIHKRIYLILTIYHIHTQ